MWTGEYSSEVRNIGQAINAALKIVTEQQPIKKTSCKSGHLYADGSYYLYKNKYGHLIRVCKTCKKNRSKIEYKKGNKKTKPWSQFTEQQKKAHNNGFKSYYARYRSEQLIRNKINRQAVKNKVFNHYGRSCSCCGETTESFLTIDHINNDGNKHRKSVSLIYPWLIKNNFPIGFQTLCRNCNWGKHVNKGTCPHDL